uniref:Putative ovule protein n=1 Tax=Solanum chacoense TaxID=4108 RepID=A0A0V0GMB9_SOLCH
MFTRKKHKERRIKFCMEDQSLQGEKTMVGSSTMEALAWEGEGIQGDDPYQIMNFSDRASTSGRTDQ